MCVLARITITPCHQLPPNPPPFSFSLSFLAVFPVAMAKKYMTQAAIKQANKRKTPESREHYARIKRIKYANMPADQQKALNKCRNDRRREVRLASVTSENSPPNARKLLVFKSRCGEARGPFGTQLRVTQ